MLHLQFFRHHLNHIGLHKPGNPVYKIFVQRIKMKQFQHVEITDFLIAFPLSQHPGQTRSLQIRINNQYLSLISMRLWYLPYQRNQGQGSPHAAFIGMEYRKRTPR